MAKSPMTRSREAGSCIIVATHVFILSGNAK